MRVALALSFVALTCCTATAQQTLTPETAVDLKLVRDIDLHPTDPTVAFVRTVPRTADDEPGSAYTQIWITRTANSERALTRAGENASTPRFSPRGNQLAFLAQRDEHSEQKQIFLIDPSGGEAQPISDHATSIQQFAWSPDGNWIAFSASDAATDEEIGDEEAGRDWTVVDTAFKYTRVWLLNVASGETRALFEEDRSVGNFAWLPDGSGLVVSAAKTPLVDDQMMFSRLYLLPLDGKLQPICETEGKLGDLRVSPNGSHLAFAGATSLSDPLPQTVFLVDLPTGQARPVDLGEVSVTQIEWLNAKNLVVLVDAGTRTKLVQVPTNDAAKHGQPLPQIVSAIDLHAPTGRLAMIGSAPQHPSELFLANNWQSTPTRLTDSNPHLKDHQLARRETIQWESHGMQIEGVVTYPLGFQDGTRYPTIIHPHGGPEGVSQVNWSSLPQLLAARGYLVLEPNYRGSGGRGVAFSKGDHDDLGGLEFQDVLAGLRKLVDAGQADPARVGIGGWSYGGYMSALGATHHTDVFKAAIMGAGISNWLSFAGTTDIPHEMALVHWNRYAYDSLDLYWQRSPLAKIAQAKTPTLIVHGAGDDRVHPGQALELYTALKIRKVPTQLVLYPRSGHGVSERAHRIDLYQRQLGWFDQYVK